ncbi:unnamed protein product [Candida verbasci]|uniref:Uncharacterized protein n=1 Tax=Candida verbasci TaxID=1227364 RepID=A0A9W4XBN3_9ASCO|nr:unnamed protein product [Candida verbasci]
MLRNSSFTPIDTLPKQSRLTRFINKFKRNKHQPKTKELITLNDNKKVFKSHSISFFPYPKESEPNNNINIIFSPSTLVEKPANTIDCIHDANENTSQNSLHSFWNSSFFKDSTRPPRIYSESQLTED